MYMVCIHNYISMHDCSFAYTHGEQIHVYTTTVAKEQSVSSLIYKYEYKSGGSFILSEVRSARES